MPSQQEPAANSTPLPDFAAVAPRLIGWICPLIVRQRANFRHLAVRCEQHQSMAVAGIHQSDDFFCHFAVVHSRFYARRKVQQTFFLVVKRRIRAEVAQRPVGCQPQKLFGVAEISGCSQRAGGQNRGFACVPQGAAEQLRYAVAGCAECGLAIGIVVDV